MKAKSHFSLHAWKNIFLDFVVNGWMVPPWSVFCGGVVPSYPLTKEIVQMLTAKKGSFDIRENCTLCKFIAKKMILFLPAGEAS